MTDGRSITRRTVARGALWAVPTMVVATASPALAASSVPCIVVPPPPKWTKPEVSGTLGIPTSGEYGWNDSTPYNFNEYRDNGSTTQPLVITTTATVNVIGGATYIMRTPVQWNYGNGQRDSSTTQSVTLTIGSQQVFSVTTRSSALGPTNSKTQVAGTYTATSTGPVSMTLTFTLTPRSKSANDDMIVTVPTFTSCTR